MKYLFNVISVNIYKIWHYILTKNFKTIGVLGFLKERNEN